MRTGVSAGIAAALLCVLAVTAPAAAAEERVVVKFAAGASAEDRSNLRRGAGVDLRRTVRDLPRVQILEAADRRAADAAVRRLRGEDEVVWAERDVRVRAKAIPDDPRYPDVWGLPAIGAPAAWDTTTGSPAVTVAVIDSGVMTGHPDLAPNVWANPGETGAGRETNGRDDDANGLVDDAHGYDFVFLDPQPDDRNGHGTHVAATIGARGGDGLGMPGVAWSTRIMPLRVLDEEGAGWGVDIAQAIAYAARHGAQVANLSLGGPFSHAIDDAIRGNPELLMVVAAGNEAADVDGPSAAFPCELPHANVLCVTATDAAGALPAYANVGRSSVDVAAPGSDVLSAAPPQDVIFTEDFEGELDERWSTGPWAPSTAQASSGSRSLAASFGPGNPAEVPLTAWIQSLDLRGYGHCRASLTAWLDAAGPGDRLSFIPAGLSPGVAITGEDGDVVARRIGFGIDKRGIYPWSVRFDLELWSAQTGSGTRGAIDDVEVRCVDMDAPAATAGYTRLSGTSMAAAFASGAAALVYAGRPDASVASVRAALLDTAAPRAGLSGRTVTGGEIRVSAAIGRPLTARTPVAPPPAPPGTPLPLSTGVPGAMDTGFAGGLLRTSWPHADGSLRSAGANILLPLPDHGVLAIGQQDEALVFVRTREDGSLDPGFGNQGRVRLPLHRTAAEEQLTRLNLGGATRLADGRILVTLTRIYNGDEMPLLVRLLADGRLDASFGSGGVVQPPLGPRTYLWLAVVDGQGRIYSVFRTGNLIDGIVRFLPDGQIDRSFGEDGVHAYELTDPDGDNIFTGGVGFGALHLVPGGKLVTSGCSMGRGPEGVLTSLRLLENGDLDPSYGDGGRADSFPTGPTGFCEGGSSSIGPDGSLTLFGGAYRRVGTIRPFVARWRPDGRVDQSFGINGIRYLPATTANSTFDRGFVLADGRMLALGGGFGDAPRALVRLLPDGRWDPGFGDCGVAPVASFFTAMAIDHRGRALLGGDQDYDFVVARAHGGRRTTEPATCERPATNRAPGALTQDVTDVTANRATVNAAVWANDAPATVRFEYGTTTAFGQQTAARVVGESPSTSFVDARLYGLCPSTTYHYRVVATNAHGTAQGDTFMFTTPAGPACAPPDDAGEPTDEPDEPGEPVDEPRSQGDPGPGAGAAAGGAAATGQTETPNTTSARPAEQRRAPALRRGPVVSIQLPRQDVAQVLRKGLRLRVSCRPACTVRWSASARGPGRGSLGARRGTRKLAASRAGVVAIRIPPKAAAALRRGTPVRVDIATIATDARGGVSRVRKFVTLDPGRRRSLTSLGSRADTHR